MKWIYVLTKAMYFPGTFMKGFWEHLTCRILHIPIYAADRYVSRNVLSGHVSMTPAQTPAKAFFACLLPTVMNCIVGLPAFAAGTVTLGFLGVDVIDPLSGSFCPLFVLYCLLYLFGASFMCSLFPYTEDIRHAWTSVYGKDSQVSVLGKVFAFLPSCILAAGAYLEKYCVTWFLSVGFLVYWILT